MDELNTDEMDRARTRWVKVGAVEILVQYSPPIETDRFRRGLIQTGIARWTKQGRFEQNAGRDLDFYTALATHYVRDWRGNITGADTAYKPEKMGRALANVGPLLGALMKAIEEDEHFFENGGSA